MNRDWDHGTFLPLWSLQLKVLRIVRIKGSPGRFHRGYRKQGKHHGYAMPHAVTNRHGIFIFWTNLIQTYSILSCTSNMITKNHSSIFNYHNLSKCFPSHSYHPTVPNVFAFVLFFRCFVFWPWNRSLSVLDMGCEASDRAFRGPWVHPTSLNNEHAHAVGHADMFGFGRRFFLGQFSTLHATLLARKPRALLAFQQFEVFFNFLKSVHLVLRNCGIEKNWSALSCLSCLYQTSGLYLWHQNAQENAQQVTSSNGLL